MLFFKKTNVIVEAVCFSLLLFFTDTNCSLLSDEIQFKVLSSGAGFTGYYIVDDSDVKYFEDDSNVSGNFSFSKNVGELKFIEVNTINKSGATSVAIKIYRNGVKIKEGTQDTLTGAANLNLTYRLNEEENASTTTP